MTEPRSPYEPSGEIKGLGITLPPLPDAEPEAPETPDAVGKVKPGKRRAPRRPERNSGVAAFFAGLLGAIIALSGAYALYLTEIAPALMASESQAQRFDQVQTQILELEARLDASRAQQIALEQQLQETRTVVAQITIQASNQLNQARTEAQQARRELDQLKLEGALTSFNQLLLQARVPLQVNRAEVGEHTVILSCSYWGLFVSERDSLTNLSHFSKQIEAAFAGTKYPQDYEIHFLNLQSGRSATFAHGAWVN